ncbi:hypothetical protein [Thalassoglobus polymorphus]|uniref:Chromosome partition protein Smc n=1 Tax=Thalassoglobus polymorphus TaxID=2527994 RepID=A0A517QGX4_9PLAN|nr:hypothetical protein [Thalassoglobus polymorphus]QDT30871.1 hypothetical protein Mal48_00990 [Thalassoglobus polymorphus]
MTKISKILAVFVAVASLSFVGFAIATTFGGPDWIDVMDAPYFQDYQISRSVGADPSWTATRGSDGGQVATSKVLPEVLSKVMDEVYQKQQQELQELQAREPILQTRNERLSKLQEVDDKALQAYIDKLRVRIADLTQQESDLTSKVTSMAEEAQKIERQVVSRREDIFRLSQQVEELKADLFRLKEIRAQLQDVNFQLNELLIRADERNQLLTKEYNPKPQ